MIFKRKIRSNIQNLLTSTDEKFNFLRNIIRLKSDTLPNLTSFFQLLERSCPLIFSSIL